MNKKAKLIARLQDKTYRDSFVAAHIKIGIPFQIKVLREQRGWTQKYLADRVGTKQSWIAQIENPNYPGFSLKTLLKLASVFNVGLIVRYVPFSDLVKWELELTSESLKAQSFEEDPYFKEIPQKTNITDYSQPKPPIYSHVGGVGISVEVGGVYEYMNPSQDKPEPLSINVQDRVGIIESTQAAGMTIATGTGTLKPMEAGQKELKGKLLQFTMAEQDTGERYDEAAIG